MPNDPDDVVLRPAEPGDLDFVAAVYDATIRPYAEAALGVWDPRTAHLRFDPSTYEIIQVRGEDAGCMQVVDEDTHLQLTVLYILPAFQKQGVGGVLLDRLAARSAAARKPIRLRVLRVNPALRFYERHGFVVTGEEPVRVFMERVP